MEHRPATLLRPSQERALENYLNDVTGAMARELDQLVRSGLDWNTAWEHVRPALSPEPEPSVVRETLFEAHNSEGYQAQREFLQGLNDLRMPGERDID